MAMALFRTFVFSLCLYSVQSAEFKISYPSSSIAQEALHISKSSEASSSNLTGRVRLYFTKNNETEPIYSCSDEQSTGQVFGIDAIDWKENDEIVIDDSVLGFPRTSLADLENGNCTFLRNIS